MSRQIAKGIHCGACLQVVIHLTQFSLFALLSLFMALAPTSGIADESESVSPIPQSRFVRTANALAIADESERADFASIALAELAVIYQAEADLARHESRQQASGGKLASWSAAVYGFVDQLVLVQEDIEFGFPVELRHLYGQVIGVVTGGRTVILSHPRAGQQAAYEQRVLADFCAGHDCERLTTEAANAGQEPIPVTAASVSPEWVFGESGPVCSHHGISVQFNNASQLATRRASCLQLMQEAETLAAELAWQQRHGVVIEWSALSIQLTPRRPEHIVTLNRSKDSILLSVPIIYSSIGLLEQLVPWLTSRYDTDQPLATVELDGTALGWEQTTPTDR